ncbi:MAG: GNAT family N-acetyltransferase [Bacteroidota bacterium]
MERKINTSAISPITVSQAEELSALAKAIYVEHYLHLWHPGGADWYMHEYAYHPDTLRKELADKNNLHFIVYDEAGKAGGYLKLKLHAVLTGSEDKQCLEIERIYLHRSMAGKGIGKQLILLSESIAREHKKEMVFLKAMDTSTDAISFYQKMGYTICGTMVLPFEVMKPEYRGMVIMHKPL